MLGVCLAACDRLCARLCAAVKCGCVWLCVVHFLDWHYAPLTLRIEGCREAHARAAPSTELCLMVTDSDCLTCLLTL